MANFVNVRPANPPQQPPPTIPPKPALYAPAPRPDVPYSTLEPDQDDILLSGSSDYDSDETQALKQKRRQALGQDWLQGRPVHLISTAIKGPLHENWKSPWAKSSNMGVQSRHGRGSWKPTSSNNFHAETVNKNMRRNVPGSRTKKFYSNFATHTSQSQQTGAAFSRGAQPLPAAMADPIHKSLETRARPRASDNHARDSNPSTPVPIKALRRHLKSLQELIGDANSMSEIRQLNDEMASVLGKLDRFRESYPSIEGRRGMRKHGPVIVERSDPFARTGEFSKRQKPLTYPKVFIPKTSSKQGQNTPTSPSPPTRASAQEKSVTHNEKLYVSSTEGRASKASSMAKHNTNPPKIVDDGSRGTKRKSEENDAELREPHESVSKDKKSKDRKKKKHKPGEGDKEHNKGNEKKKRKTEAPTPLRSSDTTGLDTEREPEQGKKPKRRKKKKEKREERRKKKKDRIPHANGVDLPLGHDTISHMPDQATSQNRRTGNSTVEPPNHGVNKHTALFSTRLKEAIASANISVNEESASGPGDSESSQGHTSRFGNSSAEKLQKNPTTVITPTHEARHPANGFNGKATSQVSSFNRRIIQGKTGDTKHGTIKTPDQARYERERDALFAKADSLFLLAKEHANQLSQGCTPTSGSPIQPSQDNSVNHAPGNCSLGKQESRPKRNAGEPRPSYRIDSDDSDDDPQDPNGSDYFTPGSSTNRDAVDIESNANILQVARTTPTRLGASIHNRGLEHGLTSNVDKLATSVNNNGKQGKASKVHCVWGSGVLKGSMNKPGSRSTAVLRRGMSLPPLPSQCERHGHSPCACGITIRVPISSDPQGQPESPTHAMRETSRFPRSGPINKGNKGNKRITEASDAPRPSSPSGTIHLDRSNITVQHVSPEDSDDISSYSFDEDEFNSAIKGGPYLKLLGRARRSIAGSQEQIQNEAQEISSTELPAPSLELHTEQTPSEAGNAVNEGTNSSTQAQTENAEHSLSRDAGSQLSKEGMASSTNNTLRHQSAALSVVSKPVSAVFNFFYGSSQPNSPEKSLTPKSKEHLKDVDLHKAAKEASIGDKLAKHSKGRDNNFEAASRPGYYGENDLTSPPNVADGEWSSDDLDFGQFLQSLAKDTPKSRHSGPRARSQPELTAFPESSLSSERAHRNDQGDNLGRSLGSASMPHKGERNGETTGSVMQDAQKVSLSYPGVDFNLTDAEIDEALTDAESFLHTDVITHYENLTQRSGTGVSGTNNRRGSIAKGDFDGRRSSGASRVSFVDIR